MINGDISIKMEVRVIRSEFRDRRSFSGNVALVILPTQEKRSVIKIRKESKDENLELRLNTQI